MTKKYVRIRERNQITLPAEIIEGLPISVGDFLEITRTENNSIQLRPTALIIMQTDQAKKAEELALKESAMQEAQTIASADGFRKRLNRGKERKREVAAAASAHAR
jgi:AbrB family looped-hinge helix DNA binding protein